jgi:hypothetical protein
VEREAEEVTGAKSAKRLKVTPAAKKKAAKKKPKKKS